MRDSLPSLSRAKASLKMGIAVLSRLRVPTICPLLLLRTLMVYLALYLVAFFCSIISESGTSTCSSDLVQSWV